MAIAPFPFPSPEVPIPATDTVGALVIQCRIVESFAVAAYRRYLPVAAAYAAPISHWCERAVPVALAILRQVHGDLEAIGIDPSALVGEFMGCLSTALEAVGFAPRQATRLAARLAAVACG